MPSQRPHAPPAARPQRGRAGALHVSRLFDGERWHADVALTIDDQGRVASLRPSTRPPRDAVRFEGMAAPGLIDVQVNGVAGVAFNDAPDLAGFERATAAMRDLGVCHYLASLITDAEARRADAQRAVTAARDQHTELLGVHYEGPYLAPSRRGIHPLEHLQAWTGEGGPTRGEWGTGGTDMITVAPEHVPPSAIAVLVARGFAVSLGHTDASYAQVVEAARAGACGLTHFFNAMSPLHHRAPGAVGAGLERDDLILGLIVDGHHLDDAVVRMLLSRVGETRLCVVSDGMPPMGTADAVAGGRLVDADGRLAGACLGLGPAVRRLHDALSVPWEAAFRMASQVPARWLGLDHELGWLRPGYRASLTVFDEDGEVTATVVDGHVRERL